MATVALNTRNQMEDEGGFTILDILISIIVIGILTAVITTAIFSIIRTESERVIAQELPVIGEEIETFFAKTPTATKVDADNIVNIPEGFKSTNVVFAGTSSDYCVISTADYDGSRYIEQGDASYVTSKETPYLVYQGVAGGVVEMTDISGLSCIKSGVSAL